MSELHENSSSEQPADLNASLALLSASGAAFFDPVRFRYIEAMALRAAAQDRAVARIVEKRAIAALAAYRADFSRARSEAEKIVTQVAEDFPDSSVSVQQLFEHCDYRGIKRLQARLERSRRQGVPLPLIGEVSAQDTATGPAGVAFDDILMQQESDIVQSPSRASASRGELKSIKRFRKAQQKISTDKLVDRAISECPDDCGPLNPQMLAIRSLSVMRELSPQYLNRFVTYIDTLLWLEQCAEKPSVPATKKGARS